MSLASSLTSLTSRVGTRSIGARVLPTSSILRRDFSSNSHRSTPSRSEVFKVSDGIVDRGIGIIAMEVYFPTNFVSQEALEKYDGVSSGKYVVGLGQTNMAVADEREDINSICLTAVQNLLEKYSISPHQIGRVEVGTETLIDKSKSVKTELMRLFSPSGNTDIEGCDTINACYGGTSAFFNACNWMSAPDWELDGRYALVVAGDIAVYEKGPARPTGGCGAVALLIGPNAPLRLEHGLRASHSESAYDFYKPRLASEFPIVDGKLSNRCYLRSIDLCYSRLRKKIERRYGEEAVGEGLNFFQHFAFHSPYNKLIQKSFGRLVLQEYYSSTSSSSLKTSPSLSSSLSEEQKEVLERFRLDPGEGYESKELDKAVLSLSKQKYEKMVLPTTFLSKEIGNTYTASLWGSLVSLVATAGGSLSGTRVGMFSYGSGLCSSMFVLSGGVPSSTSTSSTSVSVALDQMKNNLNLFERLKNRREITPQQFTDILERRTRHYGTNVIPTSTSDLSTSSTTATTGTASSPSPPSSPSSSVRPGTFYLTEIDELWRRSYSRSSSFASSDSLGFSSSSSQLTSASAS